MPLRARRRPQRGQSLVIFALIAVVLLAVVGLAVDGGFSYFASDRLERGAMAAALAGVPDMPDFSTAPNDATSTAVAAAAKNGWTSGGPNNIAISVQKVLNTTVTPNVFYNNRLQVTITSDVPVFFMKLLGFSSHREARTAVAEYLRPITFGQPGSVLGSTVDALGTPSNFYFMRSEGWGTDRGQGDAYGPNPSNAWTSFPSAPNVDVHELSADNGTETASQPFTSMPTRGGQNYQIYVPAGQTANVQVYNPVFAPDNGATSASGYNYHEDDTDFPETTVAGAPAGKTCSPGANVSPSYCVGPANVDQWPVMSYTVYKVGNPFDHQTDQWLSNLRIGSVDGTAGTGTYTIPGSAAAPQSLATLTDYHQWVDVQKAPSGAQAVQLAVGGGPIYNGAGTDGLAGGPNGTTYRLRVDQLDDNPAAPSLLDPGADGRAQNQNSQAHKGYAVEVTGCGALPATSCTVTALDDITLYTPIKAGGGSLPLVSIPPEYAGHDFSLYIYDPGDVTCNASGCSNVLTVLEPNGAVATTTNPNGATYSTGSGEGDSTNPATFSPAPAIVAGQDSIQTQNQAASPPNIYNGHWIEFYITVPTTYSSIINPGDPTTWFWSLQYNTSQPAGDTITANLGFTGAPVHLVSG